MPSLLSVAFNESGEVTVQAISSFGDPLHIELNPDKWSQALSRGSSGSPVVQNGTIIDFVTGSQALLSNFSAIVAAELWKDLKPYLLTDNLNVKELKQGDSLDDMVVDVYIGVDPSTL